jgi:hypothetical protein
MIKSPMPPLQKFGFVAGLGAFGGIATVGVSFGDK